MLALSNQLAVDFFVHCFFSPFFFSWNVKPMSIKKCDTSTYCNTTFFFIKCFIIVFWMLSRNSFKCRWNMISLSRLPDKEPMRKHHSSVIFCLQFVSQSVPVSVFPLKASSIPQRGSEPTQQIRNNSALLFNIMPQRSLSSPNKLWQSTFSQTTKRLTITSTLHHSHTFNV